MAEFVITNKAKEVLNEYAFRAVQMKFCSPLINDVRDALRWDYVIIYTRDEISVGDVVKYRDSGELYKNKSFYLNEIAFNLDNHSTNTLIQANDLFVTFYQTDNFGKIVKIKKCTLYGNIYNNN